MGRRQTHLKAPLPEQASPGTETAPGTPGRQPPAPPEGQRMRQHLWAEFGLAMSGGIWYAIRMGNAGMQQGMQQSMVATAAMQLFMRTLQATGTELTQLTAQALATNPALEELPPAPEEDTAESPVPDATATRRHAAFIDSLAGQETLAEHLATQIQRSALPADVEVAALSLIRALDRRGYFPADATPEQIARQEHIPPATLYKALAAVQDLDPPGVGARDLRESLLIQLQRQGEEKGLPVRLLREHWEALVRHRYAEAAEALEMEEEAVVLAARRIARLDPNPGSRFAEEERNIIVPDVLITREGEELTATLTGEQVPRLTLSANYREMMAEQADKPDIRSYLSRCFREGRAFIHAIAERQRTILQVAQALTRHQRAFFLRGPQALVPLRMEELAAELGVHISTISRAVRGKYLRCAFGVFELRTFFTAALPATENEGSSISASTAQARLRSLVAAEDPARPLSDSKLETLLAAEGIHLARRTIAKYREQLKILPAPLRKRR